MKKKYFILAFTFLCLLMGQNSFGQQNGSGDYNDDHCNPDSLDYDPFATDCDKDYCDPFSIDFDPQLCPMGGDSCDSTSEAYDPVKCANSGDVCDSTSEAYDPVKCANSGDVCDPTSEAYDAVECANNSGGGDPCDPSSENYDPWLCNSGGGDPCDPFSENYDPWLCSSGGGGDPCDPSSNSYDPWLCNSGGGGDPCDPFSNDYNPMLCNPGDVCDITSNAYDPIACANNSGDPCDPFSNNYDPNAPECNTPPDTGDVCDESSSSYDYIACNYPGGTGGGSNGGSSGGSGTTNQVPPSPPSPSASNCRCLPKLSSSEGDDNGDAYVVNDNYSNFQPPTQTLPGRNAFYNAYPKNYAGNEGMDADDVYTLIGGSVLNSHNNNPNAYSNACALRVSRALNYTGKIIPVYYNDQGKQRTQKGGDNLNYILDAESLLAYMKKTFPASSLKHFVGKTPAEVKQQLNGKYGIYIMIPKNRASFGASGHADFWSNTGCYSNDYLDAAEEVFFWELK